MQFLAAALEQRLVSGVANQCMLELIGRVRREAARIEQFGVGQSPQMALKLAVIQRMDRV